MTCSCLNCEWRLPAANLINITITKVTNKKNNEKKNEREGSNLNFSNELNKKNNEIKNLIEIDLKKVLGPTLHK